MTYGTANVTSMLIFLVGLFGVFHQTSIVKTIIAIEVMILASVANFSIFSGSSKGAEGHFVAILITLLSGVTVSILYAIYASQNRKDDMELLTEND